MANKIRVKTQEFSADKRYVSKTDSEIRNIALGVISGAIFGSWMIKDQSLLGAVFMPLRFLSDVDIKLLERDNIVHFYGYVKNSAPLAINGMPMFFETNFIDDADTKKLIKAITKLQNYVDDGEI